MENVTSGFGEYNLEEVIKEYKESASGSELEYVLPESVGGTKVHLLLIKRSEDQKKKRNPSLLKRRCGEVTEYCISYPENNSCQGN